MLNTLDSYIPHSIPAEGDFVTNPNLLKKVSSDGRFLPYRGNTAVFLLSDSDHKNWKSCKMVSTASPPSFWRNVCVRIPST